MPIINNLPFGEKTSVVDSLTSESKTHALSANQGNILNKEQQAIKESLEWGQFTDTQTAEPTDPNPVEPEVPNTDGGEPDAGGTENTETTE